MHKIRNARSRRLLWRGIAFLVLGTGVLLLPLQAARAQPMGPPDQPNLLARLAAMESQISALESTVQDQAAEIAALTAALEAETAGREQGDTELSGQIAAHTHDEFALLDHTHSWSGLDLAPFTVELFDPEDPQGGYNVILTKANLHIRNGLNDTTSSNYLGNLIVGYNEVPETRWDPFSQAWVPWSEADRAGSHNIVVGGWNGYTSFGGIVAGYLNYISGPCASAIGGLGNTASGIHASVSGGQQNWASGESSHVSGGFVNTASNWNASVSGGFQNTASGQMSSVSGGGYNTAGGYAASVSGGSTNTASALLASVSGGASRSAEGPADWRAGELFQDY